VFAETDALLGLMSRNMRSEAAKLRSAEDHQKAQSFINDTLKDFKPIASRLFQQFDYVNSSMEVDKQELIGSLQSNFTRLSDSYQLRDLAKR
jgi:hypothetical protein